MSRPARAGRRSFWMIRPEIRLNFFNRIDLILKFFLRVLCACRFGEPGIRDVLVELDRLVVDARGLFAVGEAVDDVGGLNAAGVEKLCVMVLFFGFAAV